MKSCSDDSDFFLVKKGSEWLYQIRVLVFFTTLQESFRIQKDSILGIIG